MVAIARHVKPPFYDVLLFGFSDVTCRILAVRRQNVVFANQKCCKNKQLYAIQ